MSRKRGSHIPTNHLFSRSILAGFLAFLFLFLLGFYLVFQRYQIIRETEKREMITIMNLVKQNLNNSLKDSYAVALSMRLLINDDGNIPKFEENAAFLLEEYPIIDAIELVEKGVIQKVYTYEKNKAVIGYDILKDPEQRKEALKTIVSKKMFFAGPLELKQGGMAVVGRLPIFKDNEFWGFSSVIITLKNFLEQAQLEKLAGNKYLFQFSKIDPNSKVEQFFLQNNLDIKYNIVETIVLPDGNWKFYIALKDPKSSFYELIPLAFFILLIAVGLGWMVSILFAQPARLKKLLAEQAQRLESNEFKFHSIFNQAAIGMVRLETTTGKFLETNQKFRELCGYSISELRNMNFRDISDPLEVNKNIALMNQLLGGEISEYSIEKKLIQKSGNFLWIKLSVSPLWKKGSLGNTHIAIIEDITERVFAQEELIYKEKRYRALVENGAEVITIFSEEGKTIYSSPSCKKLSGYTEAEIKSINLGSLAHPEDSNSFQELIQSAIQNPKEAIFGGPVRLKNKSGEWRWVETTMTNFLEDPVINGIVGNFRDVSEKKEAEINLNKSYQMVMEQNRRLLNFSYIVSHNLRSHSSNIQAILNLYNTTDIEEEKSNYIELLSKVGDALNLTLDDLNEVVSIRTNLDLKIEPLKVSKFLDRTIDLLEIQIKEKEATIVKDVPDEMIVDFNPVYLESVLLNFLTNALKFREPERKLQISIKGEQSNGKWILLVKDNGVGIDMQRHSEKLFGLYKTFTSNPNSRGVGLFITRNQINAMGGEVTVESKLGIGTTFKVYFR